jgi:dTDP-4-dehydrorhamnose reductase
MTPPPRTFVFGGAGFIGRRLLEACRAARPGSEGADRDGRSGLRTFDLARPSSPPPGLAEAGYEWAVLAAWAGDPARCEREPDATRALNVDGTLALARALAASGLRVAFLSSDYVFDGARGGYADEDPPNPVLEYGRQKAELERALGPETGGRALIVRPGKVFGRTRGDGTLIDEMASLLRTGRRVRAAEDQRFCPILVDDLVAAVLALETADARGVVNVGGSEAMSRCELALRVARRIGAPESLVERISLDDLRESFRRPKDTTMRRARLDKLARLAWTPIDECISALAAPDAPR